ncbi:DUF935 family protein, partial [Vibrio parahaemolyticus]|nr:DUF935 family protein [Vibrio parahaemolyticus]EHA6976873.1 DUF935 family protein [Vibrio parahaemolyticus]
SLKPMIESGMKVSASEVREKFSLREPKPDEEVLVPTAQLSMPTVVDEPGLNRAQVAINRVAKSSEQEIDDMTDDAMNEWEEVAEDFMNPIIKLANESDSYESFLEALPGLQAELGAETFVEQMALYMFQARGLGDVKDA